MSRPGDYDPLYSGPAIVLWVEDVLTRQYLSRVWGQPPEVRLLVAGNNDAVKAMVVAAGRHYPHVFGVVDRDLGTTNRPDWGKPTKRVFRLPRHEIENYLLDPFDLVSCPIHNRNRTQADIGQQLQSLVSQQPAWLAYRRVIRDIERDLGHNQPGVPSCASVPTPDVAIHEIVGCDWITTLSQRTVQWSDQAVIAQNVQNRYAEYLASVSNGIWRDDFSGKEIFTPIRDFLYAPRPNAGPDHDADFAAEVGSWQAANNRVPTDIADLLATLRTRVGLPP